MLKFPCLILDHDDTMVQSETTINYPFFCYILDQYRPGTTIALNDYIRGCCNLGFGPMCRQWFGFTEQEMQDEYEAWQEYIRYHAPLPFAGVENIPLRQRREGGRVFVVSHSCYENITRDYKANFKIQPDGIYGWDLPEEKRKPFPYPLLNIMEKYGYKPEEMLVIDDMKPAFVMASAVGVKIGFAAWSRRKYPAVYDEMKRICDYTFETPEDLEKFLFE